MFSAPPLSDAHKNGIVNGLTEPGAKDDWHIIADLKDLPG